MHIFSERSKNFKSRTEFNPGHIPEIDDSPGKFRTDGHFRLVVGVIVVVAVVV